MVVTYFDRIPDDLYPYVIELISADDYKSLCKILNKSIILDVNKGKKFYKHVILVIRDEIHDYYLNPRGKKEGTYIIKCGDFNIEDSPKNLKVILESFYINGKKEGISRSYYKDGSIYKEEEYVNDKLNGIFNLYYKSGHIYKKGKYTNGKKNGIFLKYFDMGSFFGTSQGVIRSTEYKNGKKHGYKIIYRSRRQIYKYIEDEISYVEYFNRDGIRIERSDYLSNENPETGSSPGIYEHRKIYYLMLSN